MTRLVIGYREAPMTQRLVERIDAVLQEFHDWSRFKPDYEGNEDGSKTTIIAVVEDDSRVDRAASELRACGLVVKVQTEEEYDAEDQ
jgi:hypothetical protein